MYEVHNIHTYIFNILKIHYELRKRDISLGKFQQSNYKKYYKDKNYFY